MNDTEKYLSKLGGLTTAYDFRCIPDKEKSRKVVKLRGTLQGRARQLRALNEEDFGIFVSVNETDGRGVSKENVVRIRSCWVDLDGVESLPPLDLEPDMIVRTKNGYHLYFMPVDSPDIPRAEEINRKLAVKLGGDGNACDAARVLRIPGFNHCKGEPCMVTLLKS